MKLSKKRLFIISLFVLLSGIMFTSLTGRPTVLGQSDPQVYTRLETDFDNQDTSMFPNNGLEMYAQIGSEPIPNDHSGSGWYMTLWTSESFLDTGNLDGSENWVQFGYMSYPNDNAHPFACLKAHSNDFSGFFNGLNYALYVDTNTSLSYGSYHLFRMIINDSKTLTFTIDNKPWFVGTTDFFNAILAQNSGSVAISSFGSRTGETILTSLESWDNLVVTNPIDIPLAMGYLQDGSWYIPDRVVGSHFVSNQIGVEGQKQNPNLKFGQVIFSSQFPATYDYVWSGTTTTATDIGSNNNVETLPILPIIPFYLAVFAVFGVAFGLVVVKRSHLKIRSTKNANKLSIGRCLS